MRRDRDAEGVEASASCKGISGEVGVSPPSSTRGPGERRKLPQRGQNSFRMLILEPERTHLI